VDEAHDWPHLSKAETTPEKSNSIFRNQSSWAAFDAERASP
jgi:hypothetical protein